MRPIITEYPDGGWLIEFVKNGKKFGVSLSGTPSESGFYFISDTGNSTGDNFSNEFFQAWGKFLSDLTEPKKNMGSLDTGDNHWRIEK